LVEINAAFGDQQLSELGMPRIVEDGKDEGISLREQLLIDDRVRKHHCRLNVAFEVILFVALFPDAGIPIRVEFPLEERIAGVRVCLRDRSIVCAKPCHSCLRRRQRRPL
jgi:hypothetical protein